MQDIRVALRQLRKSPGFALTVILTIALGIGANTAIFTLVHSVLLKSLPVADPKSLYRIGDKDDCCVNGGFMNDDGDFDLFSYDLYLHIRDTTPDFEQLAAMQSGNNMMNVRRGSEQAKALRSQFVSGNFFTTFGIGPFAGRVLSMADDTEGAAPAVVMSYQAWQSEYGGDPSIVGSTIYMQTQPVTVVGIAPPGFFGDRLRPSPPALWIPLALEPMIDGERAILHVKPSNWLYAIGRVKPGTEIGPLQAKISNNLRLWLSTIDEYTRNGGSTEIAKQHVVITPGGAGIQNLQQQTGKGLYLLMTISALVLLVACANIANLLLARGTTRKTETSLRMALGAARSRLIQQMLTESILLACLGGLAGLAVAYAGTRTILALAFPRAHDMPIQATPSLPVLGFAFLLSLITGIVFGMVPAWITSHADPAEALRGVNRSTRDRSALPQKGLIVFQAALSLVMLVSAGLLTKTLRNLEHQNFGLQTTNRYVVHIDPAGAGYTPERLPALYQRLEQQFAAQPGVQSVGLALYSTLEGNNWGESVYVEGRPDPGPNAHNGSSWDRVNPKFFETVGQPVIRGRGFQRCRYRDLTIRGGGQPGLRQEVLSQRRSHRAALWRLRTEVFRSVRDCRIVADAKYTNPRDEVRPMYFRPLTQQLKVVDTKRSDG